MCAEIEILIRAKDLSMDYILKIENIFKANDFNADLFYYKENNNNAKESLTSEDELFYSVFKELNGEEYNKKCNWTSIEKNTILIHSEIYKGACLCSTSVEAIKHLLSELLEEFTEIYYQPYSFVYSGLEGLSYTTDKKVSINDTSYDFRPSISFQPMIQVIK